MNKTAKLESLQFTDDGTILVRLKKTISDPATGEVYKTEWHRTSITPDIDAEGQMQAVNTHLGTLGFSSVSNADVALVKDVAAATHTQSVKTAYEKKLRDTNLPLG